MAAVASCALKKRVSPIDSSMRCFAPAGSAPRTPCPTASSDERQERHAGRRPPPGRAERGDDLIEVARELVREDLLRPGGRGGAVAFSTLPRAAATGLAAGAAAFGGRCCGHRRRGRRGTSLARRRGRSLAGGARLEARRGVVGNGLLGMQDAGAREQHVVRLRDVWVRDAAVDGTDRGACLVVVKADALGALLGDDVEDLARQRRVRRPVERLPVHRALIDGRIRALGLAGPTIDALAGDHRRHRRETPWSVPAHWPNQLRGNRQTQRARRRARLTAARRAPPRRGASPTRARHPRPPG